MRHYFNNESRPKSIAKAVRTELGKHGHELSHSESLLISARFYSYRNWGDLLANIGKHPPSPDDQHAEETVAEARFARHVAVLVDHGVGQDTAVTVVRKVGPTSSGGRQRLGREALWVDDAAVADYLARLAVHLASQAAAIVPQTHGKWRGFKAIFQRHDLPGRRPVEQILLHHDGIMVFGVSDGGTSAILRGDVSFQEAVDRRLEDRKGGTRREWGFLDSCSEVAGRTSAMGDEAKIISEVFSLLHAPSIRAMRSVVTIREDDYERMVSTPPAREFSLRYPALAEHYLWSSRLPRESEHLGHARWIEGGDPDIAIMAMLTRGNLPSGEAMVRARKVSEALRDYATTSDGRDIFSTNALEALAFLGPEAIPSSKAEMNCLIRSAEVVSRLADYGMDSARAFEGFPGEWSTFYKALRGNKINGHPNDLTSWPDSFSYLICSAFGQTYGIDPGLLYDRNFSNAVVDRLGPTMMARMSMIDIAALQDVIEGHGAEVAHTTENRYPTVAEADELAALFTLPMPEIYHGKSCIEILRQAGYEPDSLAGMLKLEPDLTFDDRGLPVLEQRFAGLDPATYAVKPLLSPAYVEPRKKEPQRPSPIPPPVLPEPPQGWVLRGGEFKSTNRLQSSRIRWSDGADELNGSGPGWYADRGLGLQLTDENEPRCPVRLGRFETPADAAHAIKSSKGHRG